MSQQSPRLTFKLEDRHIDQLLALYRNEFWCNDRVRTDVVIMLEHTDIVIGTLDDSDNLIGFARVLTDFVYKATIYDLIVRPDWRGKDLGKLLMNSILFHPKLANVQHYDLHCLSAMYSFYEQWGFTADLGELGFMRRYQHKP